MSSAGAGGAGAGSGTPSRHKTRRTVLKKTCLKPFASGAAGIEEMKAHLDPKKVLYGILRFKFGSGTFQRVKYLFVHFNGNSVGVVKRGQWNAKKGQASSDVGATHAEVKMVEPEECTLDNVLSQVASKFVSDDDIAGGESSFSISAMKADYEAMVKEAVVAKEEFDRKAKEGGGGLTRKTAAELGADFVSGEKALKSVRKDMGAFNWALFKPSKKGTPFYNAGSLSITEMRKWLKDDMVLFGLVRMGFGSGKFRRTKWLFLHWSGEKVSAVKRGVANSTRGQMHRMLEPVSVDFECTALEDFTVKRVIKRVKEVVVVDGDTSGDQAVDAFTVDNFMAALEEEAKKNAEFFGDTGDLNAGGEAPKLKVGEIIDLVRDDDGPLTWALFSVKKR